MKGYVLVLLVAVVAVAFMMLGLAITVIRKGRPLQSDVGDNDDMKRLGLKCTAQQFREEEASLSNSKIENQYSGCGASCGSCSDKESDCTK